MKRLSCLLVVLGIVAVDRQAVAVPFQSVFTFNGTFDIRGYMPVPQTNGFDYYFSPVDSDTAIQGQQCTIDSIDISTFGTNLGGVVNWDAEVYLGPTGFGLPTGQFTQTHVDPVSGYTRTAPTQFHLTFGDIVTSQSYQFDGSYNFQTSSVSASPSLNVLKTATTSTYDLSNGLDAQFLFWTADNRNSDFQFSNVTITVNGDIVPEPASMILLGLAFPLAYVFLCKSQGVLVLQYLLIGIRR